MDFDTDGIAVEFREHISLGDMAHAFMAADSKNQRRFLEAIACRVEDKMIWGHAAWAMQCRAIANEEWDERRQTKKGIINALEILLEHLKEGSENAR